MIQAIAIEREPDEKHADECSFGVEENRIRDIRFGHQCRSDGRRVRITLGPTDFFAAREQLRLDGMPHTSRHVASHLGGLMEDEGLI